MSIVKVTLEDMLRCRERRVRKQGELIAAYRLPVVCFTMNIAGEVKRTPLVELAFLDGLRSLESRLPKAKVCDIDTAHTGCEAYLVFDADALEIKAAAVATENESPVARLFDIDVIGTDGEKLSRSGGRCCIVCGGPVAVCARSRAHGLDEIKARTNELLYDFASNKLSALAYASLIDEVEATPKPGLVDRISNGAHTDMDIELFRKSAETIRPYFARMAGEAFEGAGTHGELMQALRNTGIAAERAMAAATGGVNTHRGAIYSMGLVTAGAARYLSDETPVLDTVRALASCGMDTALDRAKKAPASNGEAVYAKTGLTGARGEAANGFPSAMRGKAALDRFLSQGYSQSSAAALALPVIMETLDDSNLVHRGGEEGLRFAREAARAVNALPAAERLGALAELDGEFIHRNLSPGGCADALALALYIKSISHFCEM